MEYKTLTEALLPEVIQKYLEYYNTQEGGCWTCEKARRRIHPLMTLEGSLCLVQYDSQGQMTGFAMGYFKEFDDLRAYYLEEILIFSGCQNQGYGTAFLKELETRARQNGAEHLELLCVADPHHLHFYTKAGYAPSANLAVMGKHF